MTDIVQSTDDTAEILISVQSNGELLQQLRDELHELRQTLQDDNAPAQLSAMLLAETDTDEASASEASASQIGQLEAEIDEYRERVFRGDERIAELEQQNHDLAAQVASANVRKTVSTTGSSSSDALSWEERKQLILQQMEEDSFDAESFVSGLQQDNGEQSEPLDPLGYVEKLHGELEAKQHELANRDQEIRELQCLLDQRSETMEGGGVAFGAAAIAQMVDSDELVQEERERLKLLQEEWEEKFRQTEIEASLERAKLSRERLELQRKNAELEEQLEHLRRETRGHEEGGTSSRRWLAKLGLADS